MTYAHRTGARGLLLAAALLFSWASTTALAAGKTVALLVGVGQYQAFKQSGSLEGPPNDVASMRGALVSRMGVADGNIRSLVDQQATRANILAELAQLKSRTVSGDHIIVYLSGHGTSRLDVGADKPFTASLPYSTGAFLTYEFSFDRPSEGMIVGRTDLQPIIRDLEAGGRSLWVISDSCFSGQQVRSLALASNDRLPGRFIPSRYAQEGSRIVDNNGARVPPEPYPYRNTVFFAASAEGEVAADIGSRSLAKYPTIDGKPHGAFTDALLRVLDGKLFADYDGNGRIDYAEMHAAIAQFSSERGYGQAPQRLPSVSEDSNQLAARQLVPAPQSASFVRPSPTAPLRISAAALPGDLLQTVRNVKGIEVLPGDYAAPDLKLVPSNKNPDDTVLRTPAGDLIATFLKGTPARDVAGTLTQFAWAKRMRSLGELGRRGLLNAEISPSQFGGNFLLGDLIRFVVRSDRASYLLLVNIDSKGMVSVLYPATAAELAPLSTSKPSAIPQTGISVVEPLGMDVQLMFAFDQAVPELARLQGLFNVDASDARLREIEQLLTKAAGKFTMASSELRVLAKPSP
jgi:hypothetical protein